MRFVLFTITLLFSITTYCQTYTFDKVLEYEVQKPSESARKDVEKRFYFINTQDNSYVAIATQRTDETFGVVFRDDKTNKIAELVVDKVLNSSDQILSIDKKFLNYNSYKNPVFIDDYSISTTSKDSLLEVYKYTYKRSKVHNRFKTKNHVIVVNKTFDYFMPGVGFGDYYSLLKWGEKFPKGLVQESLTEKLDGSIVSHSILMKISDCDKVFVFK